MRKVLLMGLLLAACQDDGGSADEGGADANPRPPGLAGLDAAPDARTPDDASRPDAASSADDAAPGERDAAPVDRTELILEPAQVELVAAEPPPSVQLQAFRVATGGAREPIAPADIAWIVDPPDLGAVAADTGLFTAAGPVGDVRVYAEHGSDTAVSEIRVLGHQDIVVPGTAPDAPQRFLDAGEGVDCVAPDLDYPEPFTAFPRNIRGVTFQWDDRGHALFEAEFRVGEQVTRWYTGENELTPDGEPWLRLLDLAAGGQLRLRLRGLGGSGADACATAEQVYLIDTTELKGAIYYWSTADFGIMRLAAGDTAPEPFLAPAVAPELNCPACHALSRTGHRIAFTRTTFPPFGDLAVSDIDQPRQLAYDPTGVAGYFPSWAPDDVHLVAGAGGRLVIRDADTGAETGSLPLPEGFVGGSPDWSWDGGRIAAAIGTRANNFAPDVGIMAGSIAEWVAGPNGAWGAATVLVEAGGEANDRPAYSPDGRFLAFTRSGAAAGGGMGNASNSLWILDDGGPPMELARANRGAGLGNSWPKWSPMSGRGRLWLAFSSTRDYGHLLRNGGADGARPQIWITGIDPDADGDDPSAPAFWLPYQGIGSGNHIPYWAPYEKEPDDFGP